LQENLESLQTLREHLRSARGASDTVPIVLQYNKRDLADVLGEDELDRNFRFRSDLPTFPTVATEGHGVFEAFVQAAALLVESKILHYGLARDQDEPRLVAEGVREKLWRLCDDARRTRTVVPLAELPRTQVAVPETEPTLGYSLADELQRPAAATALDTADEPEFRYELRDSAGSRRQPAVLTPADLDLDLGSELLDFHPAAAREPLPENGLLDQTVQANLELAQRFGEVDEQRSLLERKVQELVDVAQQTVHDLNRPLSALRLMLSTLTKGYLGKLSEPVGKAVQNGLLAVQQMDRLVRDLLDSSRLDYDGLRLQFAECELANIVHQVLATLQYELAEREVQVVVDALPCIPVDAWAMTKVFMNLLGNAILYGPVDRPPLIRIDAEDVGAEWQIRIGDNGIGIPEQDLPRLFRRFERGSNTAGLSGTGLGLHIIKEIVQGHGGWVSLQSTVGVGTTFTLHLPKQPVQPAHSPVTETAARADL
jgi:signal transduction histidine kinase